MYDIVHTLHSINRWIVLILGVIVVALGIYGWLSKRDWSDTDDRLGQFYTIFLDIQLVLGLLLYFIFSPIITSAFKNFGGAMGDSDIRFYLVEHSLIMIIAVILAHVGRSRVKKAETSLSKYKNATIFYGISLLLILMMIPWGGR